MIYILLSIALSIASMLELLSNNKSINKFLLISITICLTILTGTRTWGGEDLDNYRAFFENIDSSVISYGIFYEALNRFAIFLNLTFDQFLLILAAIVIPPQAYFFHKFCRYPSTALFLFYALNFIWLDHILIRQSIASVFILFAASLYIAGKSIGSAVSVAVATLFHASALLFSTMSVAMLSNIYIRTLFAVLFIVFSITLFNAPHAWIESMPGLSPNIPRYLTESEGTAVSNLLETFIAILLFYKTQSHYSPRERTLFTAILFSTLVVLLLSYIIAPAARFLDYSKLFFVIIIIRYLESKPSQLRPVLALPIYFYGIAKIYHFCMTFDGGVLFNAYIN